MRCGADALWLVGDARGGLWSWHALWQQRCAGKQGQVAAREALGGRAANRSSAAGGSGRGEGPSQPVTPCARSAQSVSGGGVDRSSVSRAPEALGGTGHCLEVTARFGGIFCIVHVWGALAAAHADTREAIKRD